MSPSRKKGRLITIVVSGIVLAIAVAYFASQKLGSFGDTAGAADSTAADSLVSAADDKDKKKDDKTPEPPKPVPVEVATAKLRRMSSYYVTTASLRPEKKVDILAKVAGEVMQIVAEEGDLVRAGDLLCRLDDKALKIALEEATINRDQQERELARVKSMFEQNLISDKEFGDVKYQYELSQNKFESARLQYEYAQVTAPFTGVVTERAVDQGENITLGSKLFVMADTEPLLVEMFLPETEIRNIRRGQPIFINPDTNPDARFHGEIIRIAPEVDQRTGTIKVTAETRGGGVPGSFVRVRIVTDTRNEALAVPRRSLVADAGEHFVFVAAADTVRKATVSVGYEDETFAEITSGLAVGDSVVTAGVGGIREGTKIKVLEPDTVPVAEAREARN